MAFPGVKVSMHLAHPLTTTKWVCQVHAACADAIFLVYVHGKCCILVLGGQIELCCLSLRVDLTVHELFCSLVIPLVEIELLNSH